MGSAKGAGGRTGVFPMFVASTALGTLYLSSTLVTPLYPLYEKQFHFTQLVVTEIYASYLAGNVTVLLFLGRLSDQVGRRRTTLAAFGIVMTSALSFLGATSVGWLFAARVLTGLGAGLGAGTLTAWIAELQPGTDRSRPTLIAAAGNLGGLAIGSLLGGAIARAMPWPLRTAFVVYLGILLAVAAWIARQRETVEHPVRSWADLRLRPRIGVPHDLRLPFVAPAAMAFAVFALGGYFAAVVPELVTERLHQPDLAIVGSIVAAFFGSAAIVAAVSPKIRTRSALGVAVLLLFSALALLVGADAGRSMALLLGATLASGGALAFGYRGSLQAINEMAPPDQRAEVVSSYLLVCYLGNSVPVLGVGLLGKALAPLAAHLIFAGFLAALGVLALATGSHGGLAARPAAQH